MFNKYYNKANEMINKNIFLILLLLVVGIFVFSGNSEAQKPIMAMERMSVSGTNTMYAAKTRSLSMDSALPLSSYDKGTSGFVEGNIVEKKIIKSASLEIEVKNVDKTKTNIEKLLEENNGFIENFYSYNYSNSLANSFSIRVPSKKLDPFIESVKKFGIVKNESFSISDATEEYSDTQNLLKNLEIRRERLRQMMTNKTDKLSDLLAVDRELASVQTQIENLEKRNRRIDKNVDYSSLNLRVVPEVKIREFVNPEWKFSSSLNTAINKLIKFTQKSIDFVVTSLVFSPFILVPAGIIFAVYKVRKNKKKQG